MKTMKFHMSDCEICGGPARPGYVCDCCKSVSFYDAAKDAQREGLRGLYPLAVRRAVSEIARLRRALDVIAAGGAIVPGGENEVQWYANEQADINRPGT